MSAAPARPRRRSTALSLLLSRLALPLVLLLTLSALAQPPATATANAATVFVGDHAVFQISTALGPFSPQQRAASATQKLDAVVRDFTIAPKSIALVAHETSTDIVGGDEVLATITDADAAVVHTARPELAAHYLQRVQQSVTEVREQYSRHSLWRGIAYATLTTLLLIAILIGIKRLAARTYAAIERRRGTFIRTLKIQSLELISAERITELLLTFARLVRLAGTLALFYFYLPLVFSFFPQTRSLGNRILGYVFTPIGSAWAAFVAYIPDLLVVILIIVFARLLIRLSRFVFREVEKGSITWAGFYPEWALPTSRIVDLLILAFALVVMFPYLPGSSSPAFRGVSIFLGVLVSLGSTSTISNIVAGVLLTYTRAFRLGDRVQIADTVGDVTERTLLATQLTTIKNVQVTIPNALVLGAHIINFSAATSAKPLILHTTVTIGYDAPWPQVHALLIAAARRTEGILEAPKPFVLQTSLDDFYVAYEINAYTDQPMRMALLYSQLHQNIQDSFNEAGVEIMSPHYRAARDGNTTAIPPSYLPSDYTPPSFRVEQSRPAKPTEPDEKPADS